ncbi:Glycine zipper 2TM domain-containing protein [Desulfurella multipotens]|uniref:Glycine zipper 2TM domain-containing protein n=1 Tax=Desulfurella multipotens TaxID=79269 RepID=A0A1G6Q8K7_9BACT|nr:YMGG-like glycine zipper-containing protein [Desulfurella multipotens]SDC88842.1 Glycine zipper 2TM domain-containing protein [Desulfurella multipotens]
MNIKGKIVSLGLAATLLTTSLNLTSCQTLQQPTQQGYQGAGAGALLGAVAGALLSPDNRWKGGAIGAAIGAVAGYTLSQIQTQSAQQAAQYNQPVRYETTTNDGTQGVVQAEPIGYNPQTGCKKVRIKTWQNGQLISNIVKEVCPAQ